MHTRFHSVINILFTSLHILSPIHSACIAFIHPHLNSFTCIRSTQPRIYKSYSVIRWLSRPITQWAPHHTTNTTSQMNATPPPPCLTVSPQVLGFFTADALAVSGGMYYGTGETFIFSFAFSKNEKNVKYAWKPGYESYFLLVEPNFLAVGGGYVMWTCGCWWHLRYLWVGDDETKRDEFCEKDGVLLLFFDTPSFPDTSFCSSPSLLLLLLLHSFPQRRLRSDAWRVSVWEQRELCDVPQRPAERRWGPLRRGTRGGTRLRPLRTGRREGVDTSERDSLSRKKDRKWPVRENVRTVLLKLTIWSLYLLSFEIVIVLCIQIKDYFL